MSEHSNPLPSEHPNPLPDDAIEHYNFGREARRLLEGDGQLERARTQELLRRFLPTPPAVVLDAGGGAGVYALWLARLDYTVHLIDLMPLHIEQALRASDAQPRYPLASATVGDARALTQADNSVDGVLMLGPLYHLVEREERLKAWREAQRVLRPGGVVLAAAISRFVSTLDGLLRGLLDDPVFVDIVKRDLAEGQHRNPSGHPMYFTTAYFHHPHELQQEAESAGLLWEATLAIEGPGWLIPGFEAYWDDSERRARLLNAIRAVEQEPTLLGASSHLMCVARKP